MGKEIKEGLPSNVAIKSFLDTEEEFVVFPTKTIANTYLKKISKGKDIICQCDYGISRSAIVWSNYGNTGNKRSWNICNYRYSLNLFVYNKALKELKNDGTI